MCRSVTVPHSELGVQGPRDESCHALLKPHGEDRVTSNVSMSGKRQRKHRQLEQPQEGLGQKKKI